MNLQLNKSNSRSVHAFAESLVQQKLFSSIEWQVVKQNQSISEGLQAVDTATIASIDAPAIYRIYSMTKPIVSFVAMQLVDQNKLALDDPLSRYIPAMGALKVLNSKGGLDALETPITIRHLMTHTAGFSYDFQPNCKVAEQYRDVKLSGDATRSLAEVIGMLTTLPLAYRPGSRWKYSVATDVLAHVIENVTNKSLPELLSELIFKPLGMQDTAFHVASDKQERLLPMYGPRDLGDVVVESTEPNQLTQIDVNNSYPFSEDADFYRGGHGLFSTLSDYMKFMYVLQHGASPDGQRFMADATLNEMWTDQLDAKLLPIGVGFNLMMGYSWNLAGRLMINTDEAQFKTVHGEGGWSGAASTYFWIDKANDISGIVMTQYLGSTTPLGLSMMSAAYANWLT